MAVISKDRTNKSDLKSDVSWCVNASITVEHRMFFFLSPQTAAKTKTPSKASRTASAKPAEKQTNADSEPAAETTTTTSKVTAEGKAASDIEAQTQATDSKLTSTKVQIPLMSIDAHTEEAARRVSTRSKGAESKVTTLLAEKYQYWESAESRREVIQTDVSAALK